MIFLWVGIASVVNILLHVTSLSQFNFVKPYALFFLFCSIFSLFISRTKKFELHSEFVFNVVGGSLQSLLVVLIVLYGTDQIVSAFIPFILITLFGDFFMAPARHKWRARVNVAKSFAFFLLLLDRGVYPTLIGGPGLLMLYFAGVGITGVMQSWRDEFLDRKEFLLSLELAIEKDKSEKILHQVFPAAIAEKLKLQGQNDMAHYHPKAVVFFADLQGFTTWSSENNAHNIVSMLELIFDDFDTAAAEFDVQKIKTIGDSYMAATGVLDDNPQAANNMVKFAMSAILNFEELKLQYKLPLSLRIGIHLGPVVSGVIGKKMYTYDIWGPTVNLASRLESLADPGSICVSSEFYEETKNQHNYSASETKSIKGVGDKTVYSLIVENSLYKKLA